MHVKIYMKKTSMGRIRQIKMNKVNLDESGKLGRIK